MPSKSLYPSSNPSATPTIQPSMVPSYSLKDNYIVDLEMIIEGIDEELESTKSQNLWRQLTSIHLQQYWSDQNLELYNTDTFIARQDVIIRSSSGGKNTNRKSDSREITSALKIKY